MKPLFSLVIPVFQNELNLDNTVFECIEFLKTIEEDFSYEVIFVNDGSLDRSYEVLKKYQMKYPGIIKLINFTKNFGQRMSTTAGIEYAKGDVVGVISADLQDPIELLAKMLEDWKKGYKFVIGHRVKRSDGVLNDLFSSAFYSLIQKFAIKNFPKGGFDFWIMDRVVVNEFLMLKQKNGNLMMTVFSLGYAYSAHDYVRKVRSAGKSSYSFWKKVESFYDSFFANSYTPIRMVSGVGVTISIAGFLYAFYIFCSWFFATGESYVQGWTSIAILVTIFSGFILASLGVIGEYLWRIYDEVRKAPYYVIDEIIDNSKEGSK